MLGRDGLVRMAVLALGLGAAALLAGAPFEAASGDPWVAVPHGGRTIYVPLDARGHPRSAPGTLTFEQVPPGARVLVDGQELGLRARPAPPAVALGPGAHRIDIRPPGLAPIVMTLEVPPGAAAVVAARPGALTAPEDGYHVIPPAGARPDVPAVGPGYHVVPGP
jgi:hypothetical protein